MSAVDSSGLRLLRWIAPSVVGACAGGLVTGLLEAVNAHFLERFIATIGLVCMLAVPALLLASCAVRGLVAAWMPRTLFEQLREERGSMPRLAAWVGVVWLGTLGLAWVMFQGMWLLVAWTAFKPNSIGFLAPILAVAAVLVVVVLSRPCADLFTRLARAIDRRWQRVAPGTLLQPRIIVGGAIVTAIVGGYLIWALLVSRRFARLDSGLVIGPLAGVLVVLGVHTAWTLGGARARVVRGIASGFVVAAVVGSIATACSVVRGHADIALAIWAEEPIGGLAIDRFFDLEAIRSDLPLDAFRPVAKKAAVHRDLVVVTFEGVRADRTPPYGGPAAMPALADLADRGTVFRWAFAPSNVGSRSIPSIITGIAPHRVRGRLAESVVQLDPRHVVLAERLRAAGYETAAFTCCAEYWSADARTGWARGLEHLAIDDDNARLATAARAWVTARSSGRPLFLWVHVRPTADRARESAGDADRRTAYDRSLSSVDGVLAELVAAFGARPADRAPIFVVTSARGEELGEHGQPFRADALYNTQIRVPLVIAGPTIKKQLVQENVSLTDLLPTVLELGGFQPPRQIDGRSLAEVALGGKRADGNSVIYAAIVSARGTPSSAMILRGGWKLIDTGSSLELYDLRADPDEKTNLAGQRTQAVTEMRAVLNTRTKAGKTDPF